ncbi:PREDICTED: protein FAM24B, partial [Miniopterus natalensis]|uniref:protein FAM24B n=1 Tax=Miniopterus natalensis TaxID=291302 RepID=UPI0007A72D73
STAEPRGWVGWFVFYTHKTLCFGLLLPSPEEAYRACCLAVWGGEPCSLPTHPPLPDETSSKINSIISFSIGGGILAAMLLLIGIVTCIYFKVAKALNSPNPPTCLAVKNHPSMVTQDKITAATAITAGYYPNLRYCDDCQFYADFDSLPPCFCDVNEGL